MDNEQINELIKSKNDSEKVGKFIDNNLSPEQKSRLGEILSDKKKLKDIINSERAKEIIKKMRKD